MRPVRLDIHGFASFREPATVDFNDVDYFALIGPTGAGKSTIIDAITFALYGTAHRWERATSIAYALAPTTNRCTVSLIFDVAGQRYQIAREVRRVGQQRPRLVQYQRQVPGRGRESIRLRLAQGGARARKKMIDSARVNSRTAMALARKELVIVENFAYRVLEIVKVPELGFIVRSVRELDDYLDAIQKKVVEGE